MLQPGRKQFFREVSDGRMMRDLIGRHDEKLPGEPLLCIAMSDGERLPAGRLGLDDARSYAQRQLALLPNELRDLTRAGAPYPVVFSDALERDIDLLRRASAPNEP